MVKISSHVPAESGINDIFFLLDVFAQTEHIAAVVKSLLSLIGDTFTDNISDIFDHYCVFFYTLPRK